MTILLIEDEISKEQNILQFFRTEYPAANVTVKRSITSGIIELRTKEYDFVLIPDADDSDDSEVEKND